MDGLLFLLSLIAMGLIMWWIIQNDSAGPGDPTTGVFAMPSPKDGAAPAQAAADGTAAPAPLHRTRRGHPRGRGQPPRSRH